MEGRESASAQEEESGAASTNATNGRKEYTPPRLRLLGSLEELTRQYSGSVTVG